MIAQEMPHTYILTAYDILGNVHNVQVTLDIDEMRVRGSEASLQSRIDKRLFDYKTSLLNTILDLNTREIGISNIKCEPVKNLD